MKLRRIIACLGVAAGVTTSTSVLLAAIPSLPDDVAVDDTPIITPITPSMIRPSNEVARQYEAGGNPLWSVPLAMLPVTRERPLFSPSRHPPAPIVAATPRAAPRVVAPPPPPETPLLALVGSVVGQTDGVAVFTDTATNNAVRLKMGEGHAGWILRSITGREVTLQKEGQTAILALPARDAMAAVPAKAPGTLVLSGSPAPIPVRRPP